MASGAAKMPVQTTRLVQTPLYEKGIDIFPTIYPTLETKCGRSIWMILDRLIPEITSTAYSGNRVFNRELLSARLQIGYPMAQINALVMGNLLRYQTFHLGYF